MLLIIAIILHSKIGFTVSISFLYDVSSFLFNSRMIIFPPNLFSYLLICTEYSCLSAWLHLELTKTQVLRCLSGMLFLIESFEVWEPILNPDLLRLENPFEISIIISGNSLYQGCKRRKNLRFRFLFSFIFCWQVHFLTGVRAYFFGIPAYTEHHLKNILKTSWTEKLMDC